MLQENQIIYTTRSFTTCSEVIHELKQVKINNQRPFQAYEKGATHYFAALQPHMQKAHSHARQLMRNKTETEAESYTEMHILFEKLYEKSAPLVKANLHLEM